MGEREAVIAAIRALEAKLPDPTVEEYADAALAVLTARLAKAWDEGAVWAGAVELDGVVSHDNPYRAALASDPTHAQDADGGRG